MRVALIGPPNCGKSTLFNQVAGYKAETGNFHGTTVTYLESRLRLGGQIVEIVDLPGLYTLEAGSPAEQESQALPRVPFCGCHCQRPGCHASRLRA
jgi:ferrous iron transport protein B